MNTAGHIGELELRRYNAGEALGPDGAAIDAHATACAECKGRLRALGDEQRRFESEISFDRFAAGVERAARSARPAPRRRLPARLWAVPTLAMAAAVALVITFRAPEPQVRQDRIKGGGGGMIVRIAGAAGQRTARTVEVEPLLPGERLRIGYQSGGHRYLLALSIDERGEVTPLYPERGASLTVPAGVPSATRFLPDSLELTGSGIERIFVVLSDQPIDVEAARNALRAGYALAGGHLEHLQKVELPGEQFTRTFAKP